MKSFLTGNNHDLVIIYPNRKDFSKLEINLIHSENEFDLINFGSHISKAILQQNEYKKEIIDLSSDSVKTNNQFQANYLDLTKFSGLGDTITSENIDEIFLNVGYGGNKVKTFQIEKRNELTVKALYDIEIYDERILGLVGSEFIKGECGVVTDENIYLISEYLDGKTFTKVASQIVPSFESHIKWKNVSFGNSPRQFIFADHSQVVSIDARIKTTRTSSTKEIFKLPNKYLDKNEMVLRCQKLENDFNCYLVCCSESFCVVDERYPNHLLLKWNHHLESSIHLLENVSFDRDSYQSNFCLFSDSKQMFASQFSVKLNNMPIGQNYQIKLDSPRDFYDDLVQSSFHDKSLNRYLNVKSELPIVSLSHVKLENSLALFQV